MKKNYLLTLILLFVVLSANSQTLTPRRSFSKKTTTNQNVEVKKDLETIRKRTLPNESSARNDVDKENELDPFQYFGLQYYGFDGCENYGIVLGMINPNGIGINLEAHSELKKHSSFMIDMLMSYSFPLWSQDSNVLLFNLAAGPAIRQYEEYQFNGKGGGKYETKTAVDCAVNPRIIIKLGRAVLTGGYYYYAPKFKFQEKKGATDGFNVALAFAF